MRIEYATLATDTMGGRSDPTWTLLNDKSWFVKVTEVEFVVSDTQTALLYQLEGPYRGDIVTKWNSGTGLRAVVNGKTLKVIEVGNPQLKNRTLVLHCGKATTT